MTLSLAPHQRSSYEGILRTLDRTMFYYDPSPTGNGKTEIALYVAKTCGLLLYVICPANVVSVWHTRAAKYGLTDYIVDVKSYNAAIMPGDNANPHPGLILPKGVRNLNKALKEALERKRDSGYVFNMNDFIAESVKTNENSLLKKTTTVSLMNYNQVAEFFDGTAEGTPLPLYKTSNHYSVIEKSEYRRQRYYLSELIEGQRGAVGTLFVFDEAHYGRNASSSRCEMMSCIANYIMTYPKPHCSRFALLSASLFAIPNQTLGIFRMIGLMRENSYVIDRNVNPIFLTNLNRFLQSIDAAPVDYLGNISESLYQIWLKIISPVVRNRTDHLQKQGIQFDVILPSPVYIENGQNMIDLSIESNLRSIELVINDIDEALMRGMPQKFNTEIIQYLVTRENLRVPLIWSIVNTILYEYLTKERYSPNTTGQLKPVVPKIVIGMSYQEKFGEYTVGLAVLAHFLQVFTSVCEFHFINGSVDNKAEVLYQFNTSAKPGILLANIASIAEGVSIHDGAEPVEDSSKHYVRYVIVLADAFAVRDVQFKGRCDRYGNRSFPFMLTVYPRIADQTLEGFIIDKLMKRSVVFNEISGNYEEIDEQFLKEIDNKVSEHELEELLKKNREMMTKSHSQRIMNIGDIAPHADLVDRSPITVKLSGQNIQAYGIPVYTQNGLVEIINIGVSNFFINEYREEKGMSSLPPIQGYDWKELTQQLIASLPRRNVYNSGTNGDKRQIMNSFVADDLNPLHDYGYLPEVMVRT